MRVGDGIGVKVSVGRGVSVGNGGGGCDAGIQAGRKTANRKAAASTHRNWLIGLIRHFTNSSMIHSQIIFGFADFVQGDFCCR